MSISLIGDGSACRLVFDGSITFDSWRDMEDRIIDALRRHQAMLCRGFDGEIRMLRPLRIGRREIFFTLGWSALFVLLRLVNLPLLAGDFLTELLR